jgi:cyclic-di-AMP phosphodiesterase
MIKSDRLRIYVAILLTIELLVILTTRWWWSFQVFIFSFIIITLNIGIIVFLFWNYQRDLSRRLKSIEELVNQNVDEALVHAQAGIMTYDDQYQVTWVSEIFSSLQLELINKRITMIFPELNVLFSGEADQVNILIEQDHYQVIRKEDAQVLFFKNITKLVELQSEQHNNQLVLGMISLDNYNEMLQTEDEQLIALINNNLRQPITEWCRRKGVFIRRIRQDRFVIMLNRVIYDQLEKEGFAILEYIRNEAAKINAAITLSISFAFGTNDLLALDDMVNSLLELAQSRGGDQVVVRCFGQDTKYFGGNSEAVEKRSKVKARVIAKTLKDLIENASNVLIVGHKDIDFDCMGAMLGISRLVSAYNKQAIILYQGVSLDPQLQRALDKYEDYLTDQHILVSEQEALVLLNKQSLVICLDHHHINLSSASNLVSQSNRLVVIDHHRRGERFFSKAILVYVEPSASSTCELVSEILLYQPKVIDLEPFEATVMLTGITIDTNHFRVRCGSRTFEAAGFIKSKGADVAEANNFLKEDFANLKLKNKIFDKCEIYHDRIMIAAVEMELDRSTIAQAADHLLGVSQIEAVFVISNTNKNQVNISARSLGTINVQVIMEQLFGGGHFSAAGAQLSNTTVAEVKEDLLRVLNNIVGQKENKS